MTGSTPTMPADTVLFDFGKVLVDWDPTYLYEKIFAGRPREMAWFLTHVCNSAWNIRHDQGVPFDRNVQELADRYPWYREEIIAFWTRWPETMRGPIDDSVALLRRLHDRGVALYGLTNWSAETFHHAEEGLDFLDCFRGITVSGRVKLAKPDPAIFDHCRDTHGLTPGRTLFVDDNPANIRTAQDLGYHAHLFRAAGELENCLQDHGLL